MYNYMQKHFIYKVFIDEQILDMILLSSKGKSHSAPGTTSLPMPTDLPEKLDASRNAEEGGPLPALLHLWEVSKSLYTNEDKTNSCYQFILRNRFQGIFWDQYHSNQHSTPSTLICE